MEKIKIILAFCASILVLIAVGIFLFITTTKYKDNYNWITHTQTVISEAQGILSYTQDIETASRGYAITSKENYLKPYYLAIRNIDKSFLALKKLTGDNPVQQQLLESIENLLSLKKNISKKIIETRKDGNFEEAKISFQVE